MSSWRAGQFQEARPSLVPWRLGRGTGLTQARSARRRSRRRVGAWHGCRGRPACAAGCPSKPKLSRSAALSPATGALPVHEIGQVTRAPSEKSRRGPSCPEPSSSSQPANPRRPGPSPDLRPAELQPCSPQLLRGIRSRPLRGRVWARRRGIPKDRMDRRNLWLTSNGQRFVEGEPFDLRHPSACAERTAVDAPSSGAPLHDRLNSFLYWIKLPQPIVERCA